MIEESASTVRHILFTTIYTGIGGGESLTLNLMRAMHDQHPEYRLHLLTPRDGAFPQAAVEHGVQLHILPYRGTSTIFIPSLWAQLPLVAKFKAVLQQHAIDAVISDYHTLPFIVPAAQHLGIPVIWNAMGWWFPVYPWQRAFFRHQISHILAITQAVKDKLIGDPPRLPPSSIQVLIPGVDTTVHQPEVDGLPVRQKIGIDPNVPLVAMVARFQNVKGHEYFLDMAKQVLAHIPEAHFAVAGENVFAVSKDETYKRGILDTVQHDPLLRQRVTYLGFWPDSREVIAASDVMVCSSWFESLSMVALESMAMARPIVSTRVGGPSETLVDGVTGFLVEPRNSTALADKVITLLRDPHLRKRMGQAGRQHVVDNFSAARYADVITALLDKLVRP